jgi:transcription elongation factor B subunit 2
MDVFLMIRRKKTTIFLDAKENTKVSDLKRMIEGITKKPPPEQRLYNKDDAVIINYYLLIRRVKSIDLSI